MTNFCIGGVTITPSGAMDAPGGLTLSTLTDCGGSCGTSGQILSSTGTGIFWVSPSYVPCSLLTAQGSLISASGANTPVALPVGTDGQVLVACSACTTGLTWQSIPAATPVCLGTVFGLTESTGSCTVALGNAALGALTSGVRNTAVGTTALTGVTTGGSNTALGFGSGSSLTTGSSNTFVGCGSGCRVSTPTLNVAVGHQALAAITSGDGNTAIGANAMNAALLGCCTAACTIAIGFCAGNRGGDLNIFVGRQSGYCLPETTTGTTIIGPYQGLTTENLQCNIILASGDGIKRLQINQFGALSVSGTSYGTAGQLLRSSGSGAGWTWATPSWIPCAIITAKGSIVTGTGIGFPAALGVGTDGQILSACSLCATGLMWVPPVVAATPLALGTVYGDVRSTLNITAIGYNALLSGTGSSSTAIGANALCTNTGGNNTAVGSGAMRTTTTGVINAVLGSGAGGNITTGSYNVAIGGFAMAGASPVTASSLVAVGNGSLGAVTSGGCNVAVGANAGLQITTGFCNTVVGNSAATTLTTGCSNVVIGSGVNVPVATGSNQLAIGWSNVCCWLTGCSDRSIRPSAGILDLFGSTGTAGQVLMSTGANSICWGVVSPAAATPTVAGVITGRICNNSAAVGNNALLSLTTGTANVAMGGRALCLNTTGNYNTALGAISLEANTTGGFNTAVGTNALRCNTTGESNTSVGVCSMRFNTTGCSNIAVGSQAGVAITTGCNNIILGASTGITSGLGHIVMGAGAMAATNTAADSIAIGRQALASSTCGVNIGMGFRAGGGITTGICNVAIGVYALCAPSNVGSFNLAIGSGSLQSSTGNCNTGIGATAGANITTGTNNVVIGSGGTASDATVSNEVTLWNGLRGARFQGAVADAWTWVSDARDKTKIQDLALGLDFVNALQPRKFEWCSRNTGADHGIESSGFIAQEVMEVVEAHHAEYSHLVSTCNPDQYTLAQTNLIPFLVNAIKELSTEVKQLRSELDELKS